MLDNGEPRRRVGAFSLAFSITQRDAVYRHSPIPDHRLDAAWLVWRSPSGEVPVDAADERPGRRWLDSA
jgi:hypothetical protein